MVLYWLQCQCGIWQDTLGSVVLHAEPMEALWRTTAGLMQAV